MWTTPTTTSREVSRKFLGMRMPYRELVWTDCQKPFGGVEGGPSRKNTHTALSQNISNFWIKYQHTNRAYIQGHSGMVPGNNKTPKNMPREQHFRRFLKKTQQFSIFFLIFLDVYTKTTTTTIGGKWKDRWGMSINTQWPPRWSIR